jgi:acetyl-CoA carboxylase biotin carboxyl carrier protein
LSERKSIKKANGGGPSGGGIASGSPMDANLLQELVKLMAANDLNTVDLRDGERRIILKRGQPAPVMMQAVPQQMGHPAPAAQFAPSAQPAATPAAVDETAGMKQIKSPMVGTFYSKPSPESKPFVSVGSAVNDETDVCVIEAMKVFNNIKAECRGTIAKVLVQDGQPVEFGTVLFLVKPS